MVFCLYHGQVSAEFGDRSAQATAGESCLTRAEKVARSSRELVQLRCDREAFLVSKSKSKGKSSFRVEGMTCLRCPCTLVARRGLCEEHEVVKELGSAMSNLGRG
ncbi:unnamed protein product [Ectocarpus sp. 12 AP-2014]